MVGATTTDKRETRRLIVNADDLGLSEGVNQGILESATAGVVRSASMMVNMPGWDDALARVRTTAADLGVGLHFNIVAGRPLTSAPSITDPNTGRFYSLQKLALRAFAGSVDQNDVSLECAAQLTKLQAAGIPVTHLDSHRHVHALPTIGGAVLQTARAFAIRTTRIPLESLRVNPRQCTATLKKLLLAASWYARSPIHAIDKDVQNSGQPRDKIHFFGISLQGGNRFAERLDRLIEKLPPGTSEIMVHPGYSDAVLASWDGYTWPREIEVKALTSPSLHRRIQDNRIELANFGSVRL